jgi:integrase
MQRLIERLSTFTDWRKDYFLTLIYTGARRGEMAAIRKEHIRKDEETGAITSSLRAVKLSMHSGKFLLVRR